VPVQGCTLPYLSACTRVHFTLLMILGQEMVEAAIRSICLSMVRYCCTLCTKNVKINCNISIKSLKFITKILPRSHVCQKLVRYTSYIFIRQYLKQGCINTGSQVAVATKFCTVAPKSSVWNFLHATVLARRILKWLPGILENLYFHDFKPPKRLAYLVRVRTH